MYGLTLLLLLLCWCVSVRQRHVVVDGGEGSERGSSRQNEAEGRLLSSQFTKRYSTNGSDRAGGVKK